MTHLKGKEFEALILFRARKMEEAGTLTMVRYGTSVVMMNNKETGKPEWQPIKSLPDFDACIPPNGRQLIIEAKVCSASSFPLYSEGKKKPKQIEHMLVRAKFGALCFLLIHFNPRVLKRSTHDAATYAIQVADNDFWRDYEIGARKGINQQEAALFGFKVPWNLYSSRASTETPDLTGLLPFSFEKT